MDFSVLARAGVPQSLFARFLKVTPASVTNWVKGGKVRASREKQVVRLLAALEGAVADGVLPAVVDDLEKRDQAVKQALIARLRTPQQQA